MLGAVVRVREAHAGDAGAIGRVQVDTWRTQYRGIVTDAFLAELSYDDRTHIWAQRLTPGAPPDAFLGPLAAGQHFAYIAESPSGQVVGFVLAGPERNGDPAYAGYAGDIYALYILAAYQRQGIGRRLVQRTVERLWTAGMRSLLVWVLAANPSRGFYEALGGRLVAQRQIEFGGLVLGEVAYGWPDTSVLQR